jgi:hypothetical protein
MDRSSSRRWPTARPSVGDAGAYSLLTWRRCHLVDHNQFFAYGAGAGDSLRRTRLLRVEMQHFCDDDRGGVSDMDQTVGMRRDESRLILQSDSDPAARDLPHITRQGSCCCPLIPRHCCLFSSRSLAVNRTRSSFFVWQMQKHSILCNVYVCF